MCSGRTSCAEFEIRLSLDHLDRDSTFLKSSRGRQPLELLIGGIRARHVLWPLCTHIKAPRQLLGPLVSYRSSASSEETLKKKSDRTQSSANRPGTGPRASQSGSTTTREGEFLTYHSDQTESIHSRVSAEETDPAPPTSLPHSEFCPPSIPQRHLLPGGSSLSIPAVPALPIIAATRSARM